MKCFLIPVFSSLFVSAAFAGELQSIQDAQLSILWRVVAADAQFGSVDQIVIAGDASKKVVEGYFEMRGALHYQEKRFWAGFSQECWGQKEPDPKCVALVGIFEKGTGVRLYPNAKNR